jgi:ABC-2 type transport system ATP-binding protein
MSKQKRSAAALPNPKTYIVQASNLTSREVYLFPDGGQENVLRGVSLDVRRGESWGIVSGEAFENELLLEIIGSVRPYGSGRCVLVERGMMRKKRMILPHVFFISADNRLFGNMNTLEYLMYVTSHSALPASQRQTAMLELLLLSGLYYLTLVPIKYLSDAERAVICLFSACLSDALLIIFSVGDLTFDKQLAKGAKFIADIIISKGNALLIGSGDCDLVQTACSHAALLLDGRLTRQGTMDEMLSHLDRRAFILQSDHPRQLAVALKTARPDMEVRVFGHEIHLYGDGVHPVEEADLFSVLLQTGLSVDNIQVSQKTLKNAFQEVMTGNDL